MTRYNGDMSKTHFWSPGALRDAFDVDEEHTAHRADRWHDNASYGQWQALDYPDYPSDEECADLPGAAHSQPESADPDISF